MRNYKHICERTCTVAKRAGEFIRKQREGFSYDQVELKGHQDLVSYVDKQTEKLIVEELSDILPEAAFVTEEGTVTAHREAHLKWIIDPLDGTTNFVHGLPPYCVSIALMEGNQVVVGVIYEVTLSECFYAWKDSAAYLNGNEIRVSQIDTLTDSLIATGLACNSLDRLAQYHRHNDFVMRSTHGARRIGSAAADLAYVACGRFEAFSQFNLAPWDVAAGALIVQQAGGVVTDFSGAAEYIFGKEIIATNRVIYPLYKAVVDDAQSV